MKQFMFWVMVIVLVVAIILIYFKYLLSKVNKSSKNSNVQAFLLMLRRCEGTSGSNGYRTVYGGSIISNMSDHPTVTGEWKGRQLSDAMCAAAGYGPGCVSTAAGAYQIIKPTWLRLKKTLSLPDFSPESQDLAAIELIRENGALDDVIGGRLTVAVSKCRKVWASLPGAGYKQGERSLAQVTDYYKNAGGSLA